MKTTLCFRSGRRGLTAAATGSAVIASDQVSKAAARASGGRSTGATLPVRNSGLLSGVGVGGRFVVIALAVVVLVAFGLVAAERVRSGRLPAWAAGLLLGGAVANLADRVVLGSVRDFLVVSGWVVNLADIAIVVGLLAYAWGAALHSRRAAA